MMKAMIRRPPACAGPAPPRSTSRTSPRASTTDSGRSASIAWDVAAGSLLVLEAGGLIGDLAGEGDYLHGGQVIAATPKVFAQMVQTLAPFPRTTGRASAPLRPPCR